MHARSLLTALGALGFMTLGAEARAGCTRRVKTQSVTTTVQTPGASTATITTPGGVTSTTGLTTSTSLSAEGNTDTKTTGTGTTTTNTVSQPTTLVTSTQTQSSNVISVTTTAQTSTDSASTTTTAQTSSGAASTTTTAQTTTSAASTTTTQTTTTTDAASTTSTGAATHTGVPPSPYLPVYTPTWWQEVIYGSTLRLTWKYDSYYTPSINIVFIAGDYQDAQMPVKTFYNVDASKGYFDFPISGDFIYKDAGSQTFWAVYGFHVIQADEPTVDQWSNPFQIDVASGFPKPKPVRPTAV